jgi:hypothetical protein
MRNNELVVLGLAAVAVWMIVRSQGTSTTNAAARPAGRVPGGLNSTPTYVNEILDIGGGSYGNGWRYFDDGTAIDPQGNYYLNGQMVWAAPVTGAITA